MSGGQASDDMSSRIGTVLENPHRAWLALILVTVLARLPALLHHGPIDDEAVYSVVARVMLHGGLPYLDAIERKPPLLFAVYWAVFRLFGGYSWLALHLVAVGWVLLTMRALELMTRRLFGRRAGLFAALAYGLVQPFATAKDLAFNGEVVMNLPICWAYALMLGRRLEAAAGWRALLAGVLVAIASLLKQPAAIAALPLGLYLLLTPDGVSRGVLTPRGMVLAAWFCLGGLAVMVLCGLVLSAYGLLDEAWYWSVLDHTVPHVFWVRGIEHSALFALFVLPLLAPLADRAQSAAIWRDAQAEHAAIAALVVVSLIGAAAGARFYPHYFIQVIPPLTVLAGAYFGVRKVDDTAPDPRWLRPRWALGYLAAFAMASMAIQAMQLRTMNAPSERALWVKSHARPGDRLFVWGQATQDYVDANLLPASRYIATFPLTGYIFGTRLVGVSTRSRIVPGSWEHLAHDLAAHPPTFVIDTQAAPDAEYPIRDFPQIASYLARHYCLAARLPDGVVYQRCD